MDANKPNIEQIRKYLNGELDARAMFEMERQAEADPFLWAALHGEEGADINHEANLLAIDDLISKRAERDKRKVVPMWRWPVAASLLIALSIGGWLILREPVKSPIVLNTPKVAMPDKATVEPVVADTQKVLKKAEKPLLAALSRPQLHAPDKAYDNLKTGAYTTEGIKADTAEYKAMNYAVRNTTSNGYMQSAPGAASELKIRGNATIGSTNPLYVVDGVPKANFDISSLKSADIKSIEVLKDTGAFAIYGSRASQGVVVINTVKPAPALKEVNVVGYGTMKKQTVAGSVSSISPIAIATNPDSMNRALAGRVAGLQVAQAKAKAESKTITGKVYDLNKNPLPGVSIIIAGTTRSVITDVDGSFKINVPGENAVLHVAYIGYEKQEVKVKDKINISIALKENSNSLSEVVVTGYSAAKNEEQTVTYAHPANGWKAFNQYLKEKAVMPDKKEGTVKLSFTVYPDGTVDLIEIVKSAGKEMDDKAIELLKNGPTWVGHSNGEVEKVKVKIRFHK